MVFEPNHNEPIRYVIHIKEYIQPCWSEWFEDFQICQLENGETVLTGSIPDQAALHGVLGKIRDLNLTLLSVTRLEQQQNRNQHRL